jgi:hypothetical protein
MTASASQAGLRAIKAERLRRGKQREAPVESTPLYPRITNAKIRFRTEYSP